VITEILEVFTPDLRRQVGGYIEAHRLEPEHLLRIDVVLALLRINSRDSLEAAEKLTGRPITRCPPQLPPWPPVPVRPPQGVARVIKIARNPCLPTTPAFQRYRLVKLGLTREQLLVRGVTARDLRVWMRAGHLEFTHDPVQIRA
jgi:hypothetical protein